MLGKKLTFIDFIMYEHLVGIPSVFKTVTTLLQSFFAPAQDYMRMLVPDILDPTPNLKTFLEKFESLPRVADHLESDRFSRYPIYRARVLLGREEGDCDDHL